MEATMTSEEVNVVEVANSSEPQPTCPAPLFDGYLSGQVSEGAAEDASEHMVQASDSHEQQQTRPQAQDKPRRKKGVVKLSESKLTPTADQSNTNLIIRKLSSRINEADLKRIFSPYGEIVSAAVMRNIHTGENLGTAFVRYATADQARAALQYCHGRLIHGRTISVHWAKKQHDDAPVGEARKKIFKLFVRNIPLDVTAEDLARLFSRFGPVGSVTLHKDTASVGDKRLERRIAFVAFLMEGVAEKAAEAIHNTRPYPSCRRIPLMVKLAEDHQNKRTHGARTTQPSEVATPAKSSASTSMCLIDSSTRSSTSAQPNGTDALRDTPMVPQTITPNTTQPPVVRHTLRPLRPPVLTPTLLLCGDSSTCCTPSAVQLAVGEWGRQQQRYMHNPYSPLRPRMYLVVN
ncbi:putative RNA-binding protein [Trypanosoma grayi]|uniref:putative RNA-binding protein n=1 Tax=Trypanosoma grayi TaxID=71804 RepID=UPI0004F48E39|nr:putative RNA-binding protein [Trypanosoma grayi]KEG06831.1 putative RNA-binding protein [Trypanosoma grayi]